MSGRWVTLLTTQTNYVQVERRVEARLWRTYGSLTQEKRVTFLESSRHLWVSICMYPTQTYAHNFSVAQPMFLFDLPEDGVEALQCCHLPASTLFVPCEVHSLRVSPYFPHTYQTHDIISFAFHCEAKNKRYFLEMRTAVSRWWSPSPNIWCRCSKRHVPLYKLITCLK